MEAHTLSLLGHAQPKLNPKWNAVTECSESSSFCCCKALQNSASHNSQTLHSIHMLHQSHLFSFLFYSPFLFLLGNSGHLTRERHSSCKSSATHSYQCGEYFGVSKQRYPFLSVCVVFVCVQTMVWLPHQGLKSTSVLRLAFQLDTLPTELSLHH